jgi:hypothetical protein
VISFPAPVARGVAAGLRTAGLRFNRLRAEWEGRADFDNANDHGGTIRRVGTAAMATAAQ